VSAPSRNARAAAAGVIAAVLGKGESLATALAPALARVPAADRALVQELCYGTLRWHLRLDALLSRLLSRGLKPADLDLRALLLTGLYQLLYMRVPSYAAVTETVDAVRALGKGWAAGLANGVLRNAQRRADELTAQVDRDDSAALAHPRWLLDALRADWPEDVAQVTEANNTRPPMTLRVNLRRQSRDDYAARLAAAEFPCRALPEVASALTLERPVDVAALPGFADGCASVQDAAAQLAAVLLEPETGQRVLDACAAPGGKTAHILEHAPDLATVVAVDIDAPRLDRVRENLERLGLQAQLCAGDAAVPEGWWDGVPFERILLDAPCSATGVIRRHPDIKTLRRADDLQALTRTQARLLDALWPLLAPGGMLLYATCSVLKRENTDQIDAFLRRQPDAAERAVDVPWARACEHGSQILPGDAGMDGFYYARLVKAQ